MGARDGAGPSSTSGRGAAIAVIACACGVGCGAAAPISTGGTGALGMPMMELVFSMDGAVGASASSPELDVQPADARHAERRTRTPEKRMKTRTQDKTDRRPTPPGPTTDNC